MKKILVISGLVLMVSLTLFISGCKDDEGMSKDSRIEAFVSDLNDSSRNGIFKEHFHSDAASYSGDEGTVAAVFPNVGDGYSYSVTSISGSGDTKTVVIGGSGATSTPYGSYTFSMEEEDSDDWYIRSLTGPGGTLN